MPQPCLTGRQASGWGASDSNLQPLLDVRKLTVAYGPRVALRDVSLAIACGEVVGLVGPNGSGKSTLIRAVTRVVAVRAGDIHLLGDDLSRLSQRDIALRAAVVPQNPALPEAFSALEVVLMGRNPHLGLLQSESRADVHAARKAMEATDTWDLAGRPVRELSGGERQRVVVARALAQEAPLLLLDEPTAHMDIGHQAAVLALVLSLCRDGSLRCARGQAHGALAAVHDLTLAAQFCHRLVMLHQGRIVAEGTPQEVLTPERLRQVYGARAYVFDNPLTGRPVVVPDLTSADGSASGGGEPAPAPL